MEVLPALLPIKTEFRLEFTIPSAVKFRPETQFAAVMKSQSQTIQFRPPTQFRADIRHRPDAQTEKTEPVGFRPNYPLKADIQFRAMTIKMEQIISAPGI